MPGSTTVSLISSWQRLLLATSAEYGEADNDRLCACRLFHNLNVVSCCSCASCDNSCSSPLEPSNETCVLPASSQTMQLYKKRCCSRGKPAKATGSRLTSY